MKDEYGIAAKAEQKPFQWLPHPLLSFTLVILWLALVNQVRAGSVVMGIILGLAIPIVTRSIWDAVPKITSVGSVGVYGVVVLWDIVIANLQVAYLILFRPASSLRSCWLVVPLELQSSEAIAVLAGTITLTPGTVSCELAHDRRSLLVHCLDTGDPTAEVARIKSRYEARLLRIFA